MVILLAGVLLAAGCGSESPAGVRFTKVDLPGAAVVLAVDGDALLIGTRRDGAQVVPGLVRRGNDGSVREIPVTSVSPYGAVAKWYSIDSDGQRIVGLGGQRGGAHSNVRWSVFTGSGTGITEKLQGFSVFGGWGAGELVGAVVTPVGPALIGSWESAQVGLDVNVWTEESDGVTWTRQNSAGTPLESTRQALGFAKGVSAKGESILIAGTQLKIDPADTRQLPVVWRSASGNTGWTSTPLPDAGKSGVTAAIHCAGETCAVAGSVDGKLAVWQLAGDTWTRVKQTPDIAVQDNAKLAPPLEIGGHLTQIVSDNGHVKIAQTDTGTVLDAQGVTGTVTAAAKVGPTVYVIADETLWQVAESAVH